MQLRLKYPLLVAQVSVAMFLRHQPELWMTLTKHDDMPGPGVAATLLALINLPLALLRSFWFRSFDVFWPDWFFVAAIPVFWYWIGREIELRLATRTPFAIESQLARIAVDLLLTGASLFFALYSHTDLRSFPLPYFVPALAFSLVWILVPPFFLCSDFLSMVRRKTVVVDD